MSTDFLPVSRKDMEERGIEQLDFVYVIGDAYVDHPSFGHAIISRLLEAHGFRVGIISQPDWKDEKSISILRMTVANIIGEGLLAHKYCKKANERMHEEILQTMEDCGLAPYFLHRYPHQFSGGQRQRIGIARSLAVHPKFVVCDEAVSALDVSIQSQIINLLQDLKEQQHLTYLFITHDLSVVKYISDRIGVMYLGNLVELADSQEIFDHPMHPYTEALLESIPTTEEKRDLAVLEGDIPSPVNPPKGCKFHTRCKYCTEICTHVVPDWEEVTPNHFVACHHKLHTNE